MKKYIRLMRVHHYIKNLLIFGPIFFAGRIAETKLWLKLLLAFAAFCMVTSIVYVINDIRDAEKDKLHPTKCKRPIASGEISIKKACWLIVVLAVICIVCVVCGDFSLNVSIYMLLYLVLNLLYSYKLKNYPIIDITIVASGFLLRLLFGAAAVEVVISSWLYLTVTLAAFYFALGKRRNEKVRQKDDRTRSVLKYYSSTFLNSMMYMCLGLTITFYSLWTVECAKERNEGLLVWTVPIVLLICMKYCLDIENNSDGDPVEVLTHDRLLLALCGVWAVILIAITYG